MQTQIYRDPKAATLATQPGQRTIVARFKAPVRLAAINIPSLPWDELQSSPIPLQYQQVLGAVLEESAKVILRAELNRFPTTWPSEIEDALFGKQALVDIATGANSDWVSKEELTALWEASETRKKWITSPNYASSATFRKTVDYIKNLYLKLSAKNAAYEAKDLDLMLAKLHDADLETEFGLFITRRIVAIQTKPPVTETYDVDML